MDFDGFYDQPPELAEGLPDPLMSRGDPLRLAPIKKFARLPTIIYLIAGRPPPPAIHTTSEEPDNNISPGQRIAPF